MSAVYFARFGDYVKIGFSSRPERRVREVRRDQIVYPGDFDHSLDGELVLVVPFCRMRDERNMHMLFARHWVVGEWFRWCPEFRYQMQTMQFVTHAARLKDLTRARRDLGLVGTGHIKEARSGKTTRERLAEMPGTYAARARAG